MKIGFFFKSILMFMLGGLTSVVYADTGQDIGALADLIVESIDNIVSLFVAVCYVSGVGFAGAGVLKFKQHKENPAQVPLGTPFMLVTIGVALVWLPTLVQSTGATIFGTGEHGSAGGGDIFEDSSAGAGG